MPITPMRARSDGLMTDGMKNQETQILHIKNFFDCYYFSYKVRYYERYS